MDLSAVRDVLHRQPFRPFAVRLADGREIFVPHPDFVAMTNRSMIIVDRVTPESFSIIEPILIVSLEFRESERPQIAP